MPSTKTREKRKITKQLFKLHDLIIRAHNYGKIMYKVDPLFIYVSQFSG